MAKNLSEYRPSASVIIAAKNHGELEDGYDYRLLLFKRTPQTAFAPEHCVFPGGSLDISDECADWLHYFKECGITEQALQKLIIANDNRPQLLAAQGTGCYDRFFKKAQIWARDISLRITAIRETFEEVGILLCLKPEDLQKSMAQPGVCQVYANFDRELWQQLVHNDASQFLTLCRQLGVVPDLWSLHEWSAWRTPATASRKFDTVFYFVALDHTPILLPESSEVALAMWHSPITLLRKFDTYVIWLPFIMFYELSRLTNVHLWLKLLSFAKKRSFNGCTLLMPAYYRCMDGLVGILPGDDAYPDQPNSLSEAINTNCTIDEFRQSLKKLHRVIHRDMFDLAVDVNIPPIDGHLPPIIFTAHYSKL